MDLQIIQQFDSVKTKTKENLLPPMRTSRKFLLTSENNSVIINKITKDYLLEKVDGKSIQNCNSIYFDLGEYSPIESSRLDTEKYQSSEDTNLHFIEEKKVYSGINLNNMFSASFRRVTLISKDMQERCTIDFKIKFYDNGEEKPLTNIVIVEVERSSEHSSKIEEVLKENSIDPLDFSKYSIGKAFCNTVPDTRIREEQVKPTVKKMVQYNGGKWCAMC